MFMNSENNHPKRFLNMTGFNFEIFVADIDIEGHRQRGSFCRTIYTHM